MALSLSALREVQRQHAVYDLTALARSCRRRFLLSASLLEIQSAQIRKLEEFGVQSGIEIWPLLTAYSLLCDRWNTSFHTGQVSLFPTPHDEDDIIWSRYFHHVLVPHLLLQDEFVRNILRSLRAIPSVSPADAAESVRQYIQEMTLPNTKPPWAPEDAWQD